MPKRNMEQIAERVKIPSRMHITIAELTQLMALADQGASGKYQAITTAFQFGFALGERTERKKHKEVRNDQVK